MNWATQLRSHAAFYGAEAETGPGWGFPSLAADLRDAATEIERLRAVAFAARRLPRTTPKGGAASTKHTYQIEAASIWALDAALKALGDEQKVDDNG